MSMITLILQLGLLLFNLAFQECYVSTLDLKCFNDYEDEVLCRLTPEENISCSKYELCITVNKKGYPCVNESKSACEFKVTANQGLVITENITANLSRNGTLLLIKKYTTEGTIKPRRPIIQSVSQTKSGDFLITLNTSYEKKPFLESLSTELVYGVKDSGRNESVPLGKEQTSYEIVGSKLQPNSVYYVMARVSTGYNNNKIFSDYSEQYEFRTPMFSLQNVLKIIIPISCVIVIIFMFTIYCCYNKIRKEWWDKISTPVILSFEKKAFPYFPPYQNECLPVHVANSKPDPGDKIWKTSPQVSRENSGHSLGENSNLGIPIYAETGYESVEEDSNESKANFNNMVTSGSSFSNNSYCYKTESIGHTNERRNSHFAFQQAPLIPTDFEYGPCDGCPGPANTQFTTCSAEDLVVSDYQSVSEVNDQTDRTETDASKEQTFIGTHTDPNLEKLMCSKDSLDVSWSACDGAIISVDSGYQDFQSLDHNTGEWSTEMEQNIPLAAGDIVCNNMNCGEQQVYTPALKSLCDHILHISPDMQIDCSYQRV